MASILSYQGYALRDIVMVKKEAIYDFLLSSFGAMSFPDQAPVINYVMRGQNKITIAKIEHDPQLLLHACFSFNECNGSLLYGQFSKYMLMIYVLDHSDFGV